MVNKYKRKTEQASWDVQTMKLAMEEARKASVHSAAKKYGINLSTLQRHLKKGSADKKIGRFTTVFTDEQETELLEYLFHMDNLFYGLRKTEFLSLVYQYAKSNKIPHPFKKKTAGDDWYKAFAKRHPELTLRKPESLYYEKHEVLAINDKVVVKAEDLLSWVCDGGSWTWGLRAVWRGACAPPSEPKHSAPLHHTRMDFSDIEREKSAIAIDADSPGVVVFSYPRYCRYRALLSRLDGIQADWLRDSLVAALGGYAAPTKNTRILYCKDTFEYPELEGHEFVCNHLAPRLKGRPRGRRRRPPRSRSQSQDSPSRSSDSEQEKPPTPLQPRIQTPRRLSLRNGDKASEEEYERREDGEDGEFLYQLRQFYKDRNQPLRVGTSLKDLSLRAVYEAVRSRGGYEAVCRLKLWRTLFAAQPARTRRHYERYLLSYEIHERKHSKINGKLEEPRTIACIDVTDSPLRETDDRRTPTPKLLETIDNETGEIKDEMMVVSKPAEELNREFLESLPMDEKPSKISVKPAEKLLDATKKLFTDDDDKKAGEETKEYMSELPQKLTKENAESTLLQHLSQQPDSTVGSLGRLASLGDKYVNGHDPPPIDQRARPLGRSSLRAVRVKPARPPHANNTTPIPPLSANSASSSPVSATSTPITNFGIHHPPVNNMHSDDEIVEVPYKPKTPEIIDLDEYPESPQGLKKKKLEILKERGLEVTAIPTTPPWPGAVPLPAPLTPLLNSNPMLLNPAMQHQIMTQAQLFQMYNIVPPNYGNGLQPPKVIQATSIFGSAGPEKTVYGNPKDPFMPPPHILHGAPLKPPKNVPTTEDRPAPTRQDILDLTCKAQKPAVEIVRLPTTPSPSKVTSTVQNLSKNYTLIDGKAVVGSNLEITLVNPKNQTPTKSKVPQKRSSNGKFVSTKTPPKDHKPYACPSPSGAQKKPPIVVPNYQVTRDDVSPTNSNSSRESQPSTTQTSMLNMFKNQNSLAQILEMQKNGVPSVSPFMDPVYMSALYSSLGQMDQRQLAVYRDLANQFRGYQGILNMGVGTTPTTKN